jgi:hypothetical protein
VVTSQIVALIALPLLTGLRRLLVDRRQMREELLFTQNFLKALEDWAAAPEVVAYRWLRDRSPKMQAMLAPGYGSGITAQPYIKGLHRGDAKVLDVLPNIVANQGRVHGGPVTRWIDLPVDALVRHTGWLSDCDADMTKQLRNPLRWFWAGLREIIVSPLNFAVSSGLVGPAKALAIRSSWGFKLLVAGLSTLGYVSALVGLVVSFDPFMKMVHGWIS